MIRAGMESNAFMDCSQGGAETRPRISILHDRDAIETLGRMDAFNGK